MSSISATATSPAAWRRCQPRARFRTSRSAIRRRHCRVRPPGRTPSGWHAPSASHRGANDRRQSAMIPASPRPPQQQRVEGQRGTDRAMALFPRPNSGDQMLQPARGIVNLRLSLLRRFATGPVRTPRSGCELRRIFLGVRASASDPRSRRAAYRPLRLFAAGSAAYTDADDARKRILLA